MRSLIYFLLQLFILEFKNLKKHYNHHEKHYAILNEIKNKHLTSSEKDAILKYRPDVIKYLEDVIGECDWVVGKDEHLDYLSNRKTEPGPFVKALLDLTNYDYEKLVITAFEIIYRIFNATRTLFTESQRLQLIICKNSREFSHYLDENLPILRRLGGGLVEKGEDARCKFFMFYYLLS